MKNAVRGFVARMTGGNAAVAEICARAVGGQDEGDVCLRLDAEELELLKEEPSVAAFVDDAAPPDAVNTPFVVRGDLLYTRRNWVYERNVALRIAEMQEREEARPDGADADGREDFLAGLRAGQRAAVLAMCKSRFSILAGGPGTGKTHTIARAVRLLRERNPDIAIALAAPTGKAAARMTESMAAAGVAAGPATTLHALLEPKPDLTEFKRGRDNPLDADWLIVDEASMIDLPLMSKLLDALKPGCRLTLAGDAGQLASVERGRVFADLCAMSGAAVCRLTESARFPPGGGIARLAAAVNGGRAEEAMEILRAGGGTVSFADIDGLPCAPQSWPGFAAQCREGFARLAAGKTPAEALAAVNAFRVLCAFRRGPYGAEALNEAILRIVGAGCPRPAMCTGNDRLLEVANGDTGVIMPDDPRSLWLPAAGGGVRKVRLELLPGAEDAFAATVHKAQGSEFDDVAVVLPPDGENGLLAREMLYTAVTRTKGRVRLYAGESSIRACCSRVTARVTGLSLWQKAASAQTLP